MGFLVVHVFLSYSRQDRALVDFVEREISARGVDVWRDIDAIEGGTNWAKEISLGIEHAVGVLVLLSENAVARPFVQSEVITAINKRRPIAALSPPGLLVPDELQLVLATVQVSPTDLSDHAEVSRAVARILERWGVAADVSSQARVANAKLDRKIVWPPFLDFHHASPNAKSAMIDELRAIRDARPANGMSTLNLALALAAQGMSDVAAPLFDAALTAMPDHEECRFYAKLHKTVSGRTLRQLSLNEANNLYKLATARMQTGGKAHHAVLAAALISDYFAPFGMARGMADVAALLRLAANMPIDPDEVARIIVVCNVRDPLVVAAAQQLVSGAERQPTAMDT